MPKSISVTRKWTITDYNTAIPANPAEGSIVITGAIDIIGPDNEVIISQQFEHTIEGIDPLTEQPRLLLLIADVVSRLQAYIAALQPAPTAYFLAMRDALYAKLQEDGVIPEDAV